MLRRQVRRQTQVSASKLQTEALAEERQRIAREFHDTLEQELVALSLRLDTASAKIEPQSPVRTLLAGCRRLVERLQGEGRDFIWNLREQITTAAELERALTEATETLRAETGTARTVQLEGTPRPLRGATAHGLVRIAQEACANAIRHGRAMTVEVRVRFDEETVTLTVLDDGTGFVLTDGARPPAAGHFGLLGMRERVQKLQGELTIETTPGRGTVVRATVPG
jgi:signal transduction histidine kinase